MESFPRGGIEYDNNYNDNNKKNNKRVNDNDNNNDALFGSKRTKRIEVVATKSPKKGIIYLYINRILSLFFYIMNYIIIIIIIRKK